MASGSVRRPDDIMRCVPSVHCRAGSSGKPSKEVEADPKERTKRGHDL